MKRIYISFFTTIIIALTMTFVAFITRNDMNHIVTMDKNTQQVERDSTLSDLQNESNTFN